jgi:guanylate kinase
LAGILFIISAPSGSGKSTLVNQLRSLVDNLEFSVSYTTRAPRGSEQEAREYHFISRAEFEAMIAGDELLEHADVFGNYYGTARASLRQAFARGKDLLLDIDVQGAGQVRERMADAVSIFVMPPTPEILALRLRNRSQAEGQVDEAVISRRLAKAQHEIENYRDYKYILVNDVLERAVDELASIVTAERVLHEGKEQEPGVQAVLKKAAACRQENAEDRLRPVLQAFGVPYPPQPVHA